MLTFEGDPVAAEYLLDEWPESLPPPGTLFKPHNSGFRSQSNGCPPPSGTRRWMWSERCLDRLSIVGAPRQNAGSFRKKHRGNAMGMMIVRHKVRDYGQWRPIFDRHADMQKRAGLINPRVYHSADSNKSEIVVVFDTEDTKKAKEFAASADLKEAMEKAGVLDTPTIYFLESID
jgi:hypothetical protein